MLHEWCILIEIYANVNYSCYKLQYRVVEKLQNWSMLVQKAPKHSTVLSRNVSKVSVSLVVKKIANRTTF